MCVMQTKTDQNVCTCTPPGTSIRQTHVTVLLILVTYIDRRSMACVRATVPAVASDAGSLLIMGLFHSRHRIW